MKRTPLPPRSRPLARGAGPKRSATLKPSGETKRKKRARYDAFMRSAKWRALRKACMERAGGRCEFVVRGVFRGTRDVRIVPALDFGVYVATPEELPALRCSEQATHAHHLHYQRFGGDELPGDLQALCKAHHDYLESTQFPHRQHQRSA